VNRLTVFQKTATAPNLTVFLAGMLLIASTACSGYKAQIQTILPFKLAVQTTLTSLVR